QAEVTSGTWGATFFAAWKRCGWAGVDLFFCLSGFLIGGLLFDEFRRRGHIDLKRFYIRRAFKIWPSYLLFVAVAIFAHALISVSPSSPVTLGSFLATCWPNFLHVQNYFGTPWQHTWSLAVEEHFYLLLPVLFLFLMRRKTDEPFKPIPLLLILVAIGCLILRLIAARHRPFIYYRHIYPTHLRIDSLLAGV